MGIRPVTSKSISILSPTMCRDKNYGLVIAPHRGHPSGFFTKPLQGSQFQKLRKLILNLEDGTDALPPMLGQQECVETVAVTLHNLVHFPTVHMTLKFPTKWVNMNMNTITHNNHNNHTSYTDIMQTPQNSHHQNSEVSVHASCISSLYSHSMPSSHSICRTSDRGNENLSL